MSKPRLFPASPSMSPRVHCQGAESWRVWATYPVPGGVSRWSLCPPSAQVVVPIHGLWVGWGGVMLGTKTALTWLLNFESLGESIVEVG